jgi:radical SAM protein with 4Fe4S-binding SPASM domain
MGILRRKKTTKQLLNLLQKSKLSNGFQWRGKKGFYPLAVNIFLTYRCNLFCEMCEIIEPFRKEGKKHEDLTFEQWKPIFDNLAILWWKPKIRLGGGEPLLHRDFEKIITYCMGYKFFCLVNTNGVKLADYANTLVRLRVDQVNLSLDGKEETHDSIRGMSGCYRKALEGMEALQQERKTHKISKPHIALNCTITSKNLYELEEILEEFITHNPDSITFQHLMQFGEAKDIHKVDPVRIVEFIESVKRRKFPIPVDFFPDIKIEDIRSFYERSHSGFVDNCLMPWIIFSIKPNGDMVPCIHRLSKDPVANLGEDPDAIRTAWNAEKMKEFRKHIRKKGLFSFCQSCCLRKYY